METAKNLLVRIAPAARLFLGMVLLAAGILKFGALRDFYEAVSQILMVPRFLSNLVALAVIVAETFCGLCLLLGLRSRIVTVTVSLLVLAFFLLAIVNLLTGGFFSCDCFGSLKWIGDNHLFHALLNTVLLVLALSLLLDKKSDRLFASKPQMRVALGLFVLIAGSVLLIAWKEGETFSGRFDYVLNYGNPFEGEQELQALQAYLASTSISEGTGETSLNHLIEKKKPVVLLFFQPLDCHVCLGYMREMWEVANDTRGQNEVQAVMLAYNSNPTELQSLAKNWEYPDPLFLVDRPHPAAWATPFIAILDREGNVVFANAIINSSERQALLMQAYHDQVSRLAGSKLPDVP